LGRVPMRTEPASEAGAAPPAARSVELHAVPPADPYGGAGAPYDVALDPFGSYASPATPSRPAADDLLSHAPSGTALRGRPRFDPPLPEEPVASQGAAAHRGPCRIALSQIDSNPYQPRQDFDPKEIAALCASLREHGLLQPVVVRSVGDRYQLVAGERRLRAAAEAGWIDVPVQLVEADDRQTAELAIVENLQRKDLNPLEKAASFQRYLEQFACKQEELASRLHIDRSTIANLIRLLELPDEVQNAIRAGKITQGHARALLPLGDETEQVAFCRRIQQEGLSVRQTEAIVQELIQRADAEPLAVVDRDGLQSPRPRKGDHVAALEQELRAALGARVKLSHNAKGKGKLVIYFADHDEFQRIRRHIGNPAPAKTKSRAG
jgi:ParB family chromosome partitioning protein